MSDYTKDDLYNLIKDAPEEFNDWKAGVGDVDLSELDFSSLTLCDVDLSDVDLNSCSFAETHLTSVNFAGADLTSVDFTRANILECDFSESVLPGADFSYSTVHYGNFTDADMAGVIFQETDLTNSDLSASLNLNACRFDEETIWPDTELLPEDFDSTYSEDLSSLKDDEDRVSEEY